LIIGDREWMDTHYHHLDDEQKNLMLITIESEARYFEMLRSHEPGEAFVVTTAPSWPQVRAILWREIRRAHRAGKLPGELNQTEWLLDGELVAYGRKPADYDEHGFQGIHARFVLVIIDEACGVPAGLWTAVETITTNENSRILAIGNPDTPLSQFKRSADSGLWNVITIDGLQSPNFTDEPVSDSLRELLLSKVWVEERRQEWGEDSPLWASKVRGEFPLVPEGQVYKELSASQQWYGDLPKFSRIVGGADVGGANDAAHMTAGVLAGVVAKQADHTQQTAPEGSIVRFAHFEDAGANVHDRFIDWLRSWEHRLSRRAELRMDKSQMFGISMLQQQGFLVEPSHGGADSVWMGINLQRRRMAAGTSYFTEELTKTPLRADGTKCLGQAWFTRMANVRWKIEPNEDRAVPGVPIKRNDDTSDADRYLHEAIDGFPVYNGPVISKRTLAGKRRARKAV